MIGAGGQYLPDRETVMGEEERETLAAFQMLMQAICGHQPLWNLRRLASKEAVCASFEANVKLEAYWSRVANVARALSELEMATEELTVPVEACEPDEMDKARMAEAARQAAWIAGLSEPDAGCADCGAECGEADRCRECWLLREKEAVNAACEDIEAVEEERLGLGYITVNGVLRIGGAK